MMLVVQSVDLDQGRHFGEHCMSLHSALNTESVDAIADMLV